MSEESDSSDTDTIIVHKHRWRSDSRLMVIVVVNYSLVIQLEVNKWMDELDARYKAKLAKHSSATPPRKRKIGALSESNPPLPLVNWAVSQEWLKTAAVDGKLPSVLFSYINFFLYRCM